MIKVSIECDNCKSIIEETVPGIDELKRVKIVLGTKKWTFSKDKCLCPICTIMKGR